MSRKRMERKVSYRSMRRQRAEASRHVSRQVETFWIVLLVIALAAAAIERGTGRVQTTTAAADVHGAGPAPAKGSVKPLGHAMPLPQAVPVKLEVE